MGGVICLSTLAKGQIILWEKSWSNFWYNSSMRHEIYFRKNVFCWQLDQFLQWCKECMFGFQVLISIPVILMGLLCSSTLPLTNDMFVKQAAASLCYARSKKVFICHTQSELLLGLFSNLFGVWQSKSRGDMQARSLATQFLTYAFWVFRMMTRLIRAFKYKSIFLVLWSVEVVLKI